MTPTLTLEERLAGLAAPATQISPLQRPEIPNPTPKPQGRAIVRNNGLVNKFVARCISCSKTVGVGDGTTSKVNGKWATKHNDCGSLEEIREAKFGRGFLPITGELWNGIYTQTDANGEYRTFRVKTNDAHVNFAPGKTVLQVLNGSDNTSSYLSVAFVENGKIVLFKSARAFEGKPEAEWVRFAELLADNPAQALEAKHCYVCNRILTTPESIEAGIGPSCAGR